MKSYRPSTNSVPQYCVNTSWHTLHFPRSDPLPQLSPLAAWGPLDLNPHFAMKTSTEETCQKTLKTANKTTRKKLQRARLEQRQQIDSLECLVFRAASNSGCRQRRHEKTFLVVCAQRSTLFVHYLMHRSGENHRAGNATSTAPNGYCSLNV